MKRRIGRSLKDKLNINGDYISHDELINKVIRHIDERDKRSIKDYKDQLKVEGIKVGGRDWL